MIVRAFTPDEIIKIRPKLVQFIRKYGDGRITTKAIRWFQQLKINTIPSGSLVAVVVSGKQIIGATVVGDYGRQESIIVVHPDHRKHGVGEALLKLTLQKLGKFYSRVACDNIPSLKLCFSCGLTAFHLIKGPTGKPTLWLGGGDYNKQEILVKESSLE